MIPRMTTVGTLKNYRYDLNRSNNTMIKGMQTVLTRRNFNSYAEDPALAVRCFQIRRSQHRTESQLTVNDSLRHKYDVAWEALGNVSTDLYALADDTALTSVIRSLSDPTGPGRMALGQSLCAKAKDMVQTMNGRYGENFVFGGADTLNAPFTWGTRINPEYIDEATAQAKLTELAGKDQTDPEVQAETAKYSAAFEYMLDLKDQTYDGDNGVIYTNDADKAQEEPKLNPARLDPAYNKTLNPGDVGYEPEYIGKDGNPTDTRTDAEMVKVKNPAYKEITSYKYLKPDGTGTNSEADAEALFYRGVPVDSDADADQEKLQYFLKDESKYMDIGLGHKEEANGDVMTSTVFDSALQGIHFLGGCGTKDGVTANVKGEDVSVDNIPNNLISVVNEMGQILQRCRQEDGAWDSEEDQNRFAALVEQFESGTSLFRERWTEMDTQCGFLRDNSELLEKTSDSLIEQYTELEEADPAAAISEYMFARYCYDAALKVGNSVLSQSLMDYMSF